MHSRHQISTLSIKHLTTLNILNLPDHTQYNKFASPHAACYNCGRKDAKVMHFFPMILTDY